VSARGGLRFFFLEALVASTLSLLLLGTMLAASLRAERRTRVLAAERAATALAASARHVEATGAELAPFRDWSGLELHVDQKSGRAIARMDSRSAQVVEVRVFTPQIERAP
jgi:hypothetical protein